MISSVIGLTLTQEEEDQEGKPASTINHNQSTEIIPDISDISNDISYSDDESGVPTTSAVNTPSSQMHVAKKTTK